MHHVQRIHVLSIAHGSKENQNLIHDFTLLASHEQNKKIIFWPLAIARRQQIYCRSTIRCHTCREFSARPHVIIISTIDTQKQYLMSFDYVFKCACADAHHITWNRRVQLVHILPLKRFIFMSLSMLILIFSA